MSVKMTIAVVESDPASLNLIKIILKEQGYRVVSASALEDAKEMIESNCPEVILSELSLPDGSGMDLIRSVRSWSQIPILIVSDQKRQADKVRALDLGADDYITKPFGTDELLARIRTALRHSRNSGTYEEGILRDGLCQIDALTIDYNHCRAYINGNDAKLTQNEFKIVALLAKYAGTVITYELLRKKLWGPNLNGSNQILRVNMANIRKKIEKDPTNPEYFFTENGVGYRMRGRDPAAEDFLSGTE